MKARVCPFLLAAETESAAETQRAKRARRPGNCAPASSNPRRASRRIKTPARHVLRPQKRSAAAHPQSAAETQRAKRARSPWQLRPGKFQSPPRFPPHQNAGAARLAPAKAVRGRASAKRRGNAARKTGAAALAIAPRQIPTLAAQGEPPADGSVPSNAIPGQGALFYFFPFSTVCRWAHISSLGWMSRIFMPSVLS